MAYPFFSSFMTSMKQLGWKSAFGLRQKSPTMVFLQWPHGRTGFARFPVLPGMA
jgi:hypothetical protein